MKVSITFKSRYCETDCTFCGRRIYTASTWLPSWVSEWIGNRVFWLHKHTAEHKGNRPTGELAPALEIDPEAFARRAAGSQ